MSTLEIAENLLDQAEREEYAGQLAALAERNADAEAHFESVRKCRLKANLLLEQVCQPGYRTAG